MRKSIVIMEIQRRQDNDRASLISSKICGRRIVRRQMAAAADPAVIKWFEGAIAMHKLKCADPDQGEQCAVFGEIVFGREPRISDHPEYPYELNRMESQKVLEWCVKRIKKLPRPGHPLPDKMSEAEKKEIRSAAEEMMAVYLTEHQIDVAFSDVHIQFPWLASLTEKAWQQALRRARSGLPAGVGPLLLLGSPGIGKSSWARAVAEGMGVPRLDIDVGATGGVFDLQGTAKGWGGADKGRLMSTIISSRTANAMVVLDEIDAGSSRNGLKGGGSLPGLFKVLMSLIEPSTSRAWVCPHYQIPVDIRHVSWIATSNRIDNVEQALLDRMTIIDLPEMTHYQLLDFAAAQAAIRFGDDFSDIVVDRVRESLRRGHRLSLRHVVKVLDRVEEAVNRPLMH